MVYLPTVPGAAVAMLACARLGAIYSVVFAGLSPKSFARRIRDGDAKVLITADEGLRAGKRAHLPASNRSRSSLLPTVVHQGDLT